MTSEEVLVDPGNTTEVDVVFVHGLRGDKIETWSKGKVCWPRDFLKDEIETARIITWGYDSQVLNAIKAASQESIFSHSENLLNDLGRLRRNVVPNRPLIFVAHSLGGLVVKEALIRSSEYYHNKQDLHLGAIGQATKGIVFMGTPHRGSSAADFADIVATIAKVAFWQHPNKKLVKALTKDSDLLERNRKSFASISAHLPIGSFVEGKGFLNMGLIVKQDSASMDTFGEIVMSIPENHMEMCKFATRDNVGYVRVSYRIERLCSAAIGALREGNIEQELEKMDILTESLKVPQLYTREEAIDKAEAGTFSWILNHWTSTFNRQAGDTFKEWLQQDGDLHNMFWLSGKPASGKSTLMKYIHTHQQERLRQFLSQWTRGNHLIMAGFYFSAESHSSVGKTQVGLLRALLHQILTDLPGPRRAQILRAKYDTQDWSMGTHTKPSAIDWRLVELQQLFQSAMEQAQQGQYIYIYADGLDEYHQLDSSGNVVQLENDNDDDADVRIEGRSEIAELFIKHARNPYIKICIASRSQQPFEDLFYHITGVGLRLRMEDLTRLDIDSLVHERLGHNAHLTRLGESDPGFRDELLRDVVAKADGVFTWVILITRRLRTMLSDGDRIPEIQRYIEHVPTRLGGPSGLYMSLLKEIKMRHRVEAARLLNAVLHARLPLTAVTLSYCEFEPGMAINDSIRKRSHDELNAEAKAMVLRIWSRCAGILELAPNPGEGESQNLRGHINSEPIVRFIHLTAKEFLRRHDIWGFLAGATGRNTLRDPNVALLTSSLLRLKYIGATGDLEDMWGAVHDAIYYAGKAEKTTGAAQSSLLDNVDATMSQLVKAQWSDEDTRGRYDNFNFGGPVFKKADFLAAGYHWVSLEPQEQGGKTYSTNDDFLTYAVWGNLERYLESKVSCIVKRNTKEREDSDKRLLLELAVAPCDPPSMINLYLQVNASDRLGCNQSTSSIVRLLLDNGADPAQRGDLKTVWEMMMCWESRLGTGGRTLDTCTHDTNFMDIMVVMIENGANPNVVGSHMCSLLFMAATCADIPTERRKTLIDLLLQKGAELFPREAKKLSNTIKWTDTSTWPILEDRVHRMLVAQRAGTRRRHRGVSNTVAAMPIEEIRAQTDWETFAKSLFGDNNTL